MAFLDTFTWKNMLLMYLYSNFIYLVFAWSTKTIYEKDECQDQANENFLYWICYGNFIIYSFLLFVFVVSLINCGKFSLEEKILNKIGAVPTTILGLFLLAVFLVYNFLTMGYGIKQYYFVDKQSECRELQLFVMGTSNTMIAQVVIQIGLFLKLIIQNLNSRSQTQRFSYFVLGNHQMKSNYQSNDNLLQNDSYFNLNSSLSKNPKSNVEMSTLQAKTNNLI